MGKECCAIPKVESKPVNPRFKTALWIALCINAVMFFVEIFGGLTSGSVSLWADALDFAGDSANYAISLMVLSMALIWHSRAALLKGWTICIFGVFVLAKTAWSYTQGIPPEAITMGVIGFIALIANLSVATMLYMFKDGNANMRSVWLCSRNDSIANLAVMLAALGVFGTNSVLPDLLVAVIISTLALSSGIQVIRQANQEIRNHQKIS